MTGKKKVDQSTPQSVEEDYQTTRFSENKIFSSFLTNGPITLINKRAVSREVRQVQTVFKSHLTYLLGMLRGIILAVYLRLHLLMQYM